MATLYLHIGTPKTGTTAIQIFLRQNRKVLNKKGYSFPDFKVSASGVRSERNGYFLSDFFQEEEIINKCLDKIFTLSNKYSKIILTDEGLWNSGANKTEFWQNLKSRLDEKNIKLKTIVYLRRQDYYTASLWAQKIKGVRAKTFTFQEYLKDSAFDANNLDYYSYLNNVAKIIGKENVIIRPYEFSQFKDNNIIADFLNSIGIEFDNRFIYRDTRQNISINGNVLEAKRYLNMVKGVPEQSGAFKPYLEMTQCLMKEKGKYRDCSTFLEGQRQVFMTKYKTGNENIAREFLHRKDGKLFREKIAHNDPKKCSYTYSEIKYVINNIRAFQHYDHASPFTNAEFDKICDKAISLLQNEKSFILKVKKHLKQLVK